MPLEDTISSIVEHLQAGHYENEAAISQCVVLGILNELGWDIRNPGSVCPEYTVGGGRVDFALCHPLRTPVVFVEVKRPGQIDGADQQLFQYAFHQGIPMAILCDGKTWSFYLPLEPGGYEVRRVELLNLLERTPKEATEKLLRYLEYSRVKTGEALKSAQQDYRDLNRRNLAKRTIPEAWTELIGRSEGSLIECIALEVEAKCGVRPAAHDISEFLNKLTARVHVVTQPTAPASLPVRALQRRRHNPQNPPDVQGARIISATFGDMSATSWAELLVVAIRTAVGRGMVRPEQFPTELTVNLRGGVHTQQGFHRIPPNEPFLSRHER